MIAEQRKLSVYDEKFYAEQLGDSLESARRVVPHVLKYVRPQSVVDVGCGVGTWLSVFAEHGVEELCGVDGSYVSLDMLHIAPAQFQPHDLTQPLRLARQFDLAVSLEVAEHLPPACAATFVEGLTRLAPVVLFSAAIPGQGGVHHVNEQWPDYWEALFAQHHFVRVDCLRRDLWELQGIKPHYAQNAFFYVDARALGRYPALQAAHESPTAIPPAVVHPGIFTHRLAELAAAGTLEPGNVTLHAVLRSIPRLLVFRAKEVVKGVLGRVAPDLLESIRSHKRRAD